MLRSTFSTTTMASSTTMPIASTSPNSDSVLIEKPNASSTANVPTIDTGTATSGMIDARQVCRNSTTTSTTSKIASNSVLTTSMDALAHDGRRVVDDLVFHALREVCASAPSIVSRTVLDSASAFEPGAWKMAMATASLLSSIDSQRVAARRQLDARHVAEARDLAVRAGLDDDVAELVLVGQPPVRVDGQREVDRVVHRRARRRRRRRPARSARGSRSTTSPPSGRAPRPCCGSSQTRIA